MRRDFGKVGSSHCYRHLDCHPTPQARSNGVQPSVSAMILAREIDVRQAQVSHLAPSKVLHQIQVGFRGEEIQVQQVCSQCGAIAQTLF